MNRRSLTPTIGTPTQGLPATRRATGGARREISSRITLVAEGVEYTGWALNISRGGIRVVIEERVELGQEFEIRELETDLIDVGPFRGRVVWVQDEPDGSVVGLEFVGPVIPRFADRQGSSAPPGPSTVRSPLSSPPPPNNQPADVPADSTDIKPGGSSTPPDPAPTP